MRTAALALVALGVVACGAGHPNRASAATTNATTANLQSVFNSAQPGDTIQLASGDYGKFSGGAKSGMVTLKPQAGAAVTMSPQLSGAANITFTGMTLDGISIQNGSHDIKVLNNTFTDQALLNVTRQTNANILIDGNTFNNISACSDCPEGRVQVTQYPSGTAPVGVTISHNYFGGGGESDGIQVGAYGVVIDGNEFSDIQQGNYSRHIDSIQLYGQSHTRIINNYLHNFTTAIMAPDGGNGEDIENNVFVAPNPNSTAIQLGGMDGVTFLHNTVKNTNVLILAAKDGGDSTNVTLRDNDMVAAQFTTDGCSGCAISYNLFTRGASGSSAITATPRFAGGTSPTTYSGWALAAGSPGKGNASDGSDRGINPGASVPPPTGTGTGAGSPPTSGSGTPPTTTASDPTATASVTPVALTTAPAAATIAARWTMKPSRPRVNQRVVLTAPKTKAGGRKCTWTIAKGVYRRGCQIAVRFAKAGRKHISVRIVDRSGAVVRAVRDITVVRRATISKKHRARAHAAVV